jgi:hypothetical protein
MIWKQRLNSLSDKKFVQRYKLSKATFQGLADKIKPYVAVDLNDPQACKSSGSGIDTELCLSMTLRYLCGGHALEIIDLHGVGKSSFYYMLWLTISAINKVLSLPRIAMKNPEGLEQLRP